MRINVRVESTVSNSAVKETKAECRLYSAKFFAHTYFSTNLSKISVLLYRTKCAKFCLILCRKISTAYNFSAENKATSVQTKEQNSTQNLTKFLKKIGHNSGKFLH